MNAVLRSTAQAVPKATLYRAAAGIALVSAAGAVALAWLLRPSMGAVIGYMVWPFSAVALAWVVAGISRLQLVGYLPSQPKDDDFIPRALQPWIRFWLLARLGLLGAMLLAFLAIAVTATAAGEPGANYCVQ